ncbi:hypothetical protein BCR34DRAFT_275421 [Clohesyomyces aquaticus]|uniref:Uncharacterized protein n=1 Tax=Clohesyomyces aquaticus TaxID=1231657 RepID=A0A1Y1ZSD3_9PLEO|nr:hypothetical protein BCR34DRAFT_275421 [Clohesyomyces aquaticus]
MRPTRPRARVELQAEPGVVAAVRLSMDVCLSSLAVVHGPKAHWPGSVTSAPAFLCISHCLTTKHSPRHIHHIFACSSLTPACDSPISVTRILCPHPAFRAPPPSPTSFVSELVALPAQRLTISHSYNLVCILIRLRSSLLFPLRAPYSRIFRNGIFISGL